MDINGINYEFKVGLRTLKTLKEVYSLDITDLSFGMLDVVRLAWCSLKAYSNYEGTEDELADAMDEDMNLYKEAQDKIGEWSNKLADAYTEAKN